MRSVSVRMEPPDRPLDISSTCCLDTTFLLLVVQPLCRQQTVSRDRNDIPWRALSSLRSNRAEQLMKRQKKTSTVHHTYPCFRCQRWLGEEKMDARHDGSGPRQTCASYVDQRHIERNHLLTWIHRLRKSLGEDCHWPIWCRVR